MSTTYGKSKTRKSTVEDAVGSDVGPPTKKARTDTRGVLPQSPAGLDVDETAPNTQSHHSLNMDASDSDEETISPPPGEETRASDLYLDTVRMTYSSDI